MDDWLELVLKKYFDISSHSSLIDTLKPVSGKILEVCPILNGTLLR